MCEDTISGIAVTFSTSFSSGSLNFEPAVDGCPRQEHEVIHLASKEQKCGPICRTKRLCDDASGDFRGWIEYPVKVPSACQQISMEKTAQGDGFEKRRGALEVD